MYNGISTAHYAISEKCFVSNVLQQQAQGNNERIQLDWCIWCGENIQIFIYSTVSALLRLPVSPHFAAKRARKRDAAAAAANYHSQWLSRAMRWLPACVRLQSIRIENSVSAPMRCVTFYAHSSLCSISHRRRRNQCGRIFHASQFSQPLRRRISNDANKWNASRRNRLAHWIFERDAVFPRNFVDDKFPASPTQFTNHR